jgi:hypothetical protein
MRLESCHRRYLRVNNLNFDAALKLAFAGSYEQPTPHPNPEILKVFKHTKLQRRDVTFRDTDEHSVGEQVRL